MRESNQGFRDEPPGSSAEASAAAAAPQPLPPGDPPLPVLPPILPGLWTWFTIIGTLGLFGILWGQSELAFSLALAGAFVAAHAADRDPSFASLHRLLTGLLVLGGATVFSVLVFWIATQPAAGATRLVAIGIAGGAALLCLLSALPPVVDALAVALFRVSAPTHVLRLAARLVMMVFLLAFPGWVAFPAALDHLVESGEPLLTTGALLSSMVGLSLLALAAVGFRVRRDARATFDRLGLRSPPVAHYGIVALGMAALYVLNTGAESLQQRWFPDLWDHDQHTSRLIAGGLGFGGSLLLGVSAGVGEELAMRGALQPRLGLVLTSLVFAVLHVHYSWFGVATIFLLGLLLGVLRDRTSTTVAIFVHVLYDIAAAFAAGSRS